MKDDKANGVGESTWANGASYKGESLNNKMHGQGTYIYVAASEFSTYVGQLKEGRFEGKGMMKYKDGRIFEGEFKNDKKNGAGIMKSSAGNIVEQGIWKDDLFIK